MMIIPLSEQEDCQGDDVGGNTKAIPPNPTHIVLDIDDPHAAYDRRNIQSEEVPIKENSLILRLV